MEAQDEVTQPSPKKHDATKAPKRARFYTHLAKQYAVIARRASGESNRRIAKDLHMAMATVAKVLSQSQLAMMVNEGRSSVVELIPKSVRVADYRLSKNDGNVAMGILRGTGVLRQDAVNVNVMAANGDVIVGAWPEFAGALPGTVQGEAQTVTDAQSTDTAPVEPTRS